MEDESKYHTNRIFQYLKSGVEVEDEEFNSIYPEHIREIAETHFSYVAIAKKAAQFLVQKPGIKVLDIGSGAGKFCMIGAVCTEGHFTGVELRERFHKLSRQISKRFQLTNIRFIHSNITEIEFSDYEAFYLFNPFYENIVKVDRMDDSLKLDNDLYEKYSSFVKTQLEAMPVGTRVVTYFSYYDEIPDDYKILEKDDQEKITLWEKVAPSKS